MVSGYCDIGARSFLGVNAALADHVYLAKDCLVGMAAAVTKSFDTPGLILNGNPAEAAKVSSYRYYRIKP